MPGQGGCWTAITLQTRLTCLGTKSTGRIAVVQQLNLCQMIAVTQCAAFAVLASDELIVGISPSAKHRLLLSSYLLNLERGPLAVRDMIIADLRRFHELGARLYTADLLLVLRLFLTDYPCARCIQTGNRFAGRTLSAASLAATRQSAGGLKIGTSKKLGHHASLKNSLSLASAHATRSGRPQ
jgi:hypothetical protein